MRRRLRVAMGWPRDCRRGLSRRPHGSRVPRVPADTLVQTIPDKSGRPNQRRVKAQMSAGHRDCLAMQIAHIKECIVCICNKFAPVGEL